MNFNLVQSIAGCAEQAQDDKEVTRRRGVVAVEVANAVSSGTTEVRKHQENVSDIAQSVVVKVTDARRTRSKLAASIIKGCRCVIVTSCWVCATGTTIKLTAAVIQRS